MVRKCAIRVLCASAAVLLAGAPVGLASNVSQLEENGDVISPSSTLGTTATLAIGNDIQNPRAIDNFVRTDNPPTAPADADHGLIFSGGEGANDQNLTVTG